MDPVCIVPAGDVCGEAATWDAAMNCLYWTDINRFLLHVYDPVAGQHRPICLTSRLSRCRLPTVRGHFL